VIFLDQLFIFFEKWNKYMVFGSLEIKIWLFLMVQIKFTILRQSIFELQKMNNIFGQPEDTLSSSSIARLTKISMVSKILRKASDPRAILSPMRVP